MYINLIYLSSLFAPCLFSLRNPSTSLHLLNRKTDWSCPPLTIPNAVVKYRRRNKIAKIRCNFGFGIMGGDRRLTCIRNKWMGKIPHCITIGCEDVSLTNGEAIKLYNGALVHFSCQPGYQLQGSPAIFCDGVKWNATSPNCTIPNEEVDHKYCNFEFRRMCDWIQDHNDDYNWKLSSGVLNSVTGSLGAKFDHTLKKSYGHYLYVDSNENWSSQKKARIFLPILAIPEETPSCATLWYHMNGPTTGRLNVYLKPETLPFEILIPRDVLTGDHRDQWNRLIIHISDISDDYFQIVLEACGGDGYMSDIAVDDFQVLSGSDCISIDIEQATSTQMSTETNSSSSVAATSTRTSESNELYSTRARVNITVTPIPLRPNISTTLLSTNTVETSTEKRTTQIESTTKSPSTTRQLYSSTIKSTPNINPDTEEHLPSTTQSSKATTFSSTELSTSSAKWHKETTTKQIPSTSTGPPGSKSSIYSTTGDQLISIQTTTPSQTNPKRLSFESSYKPSLSTPILVSFLGLTTIAAILAIYWVKRKQQSSLYDYSDINSNNEDNTTEEMPAQRDTSTYAPLGDDSLVPVDFE